MFNISVDSQKLTSSAYTEDMDKLLIKSEVVEGYLQSNKEFMNDDSKENTERTERTNEYSKLQMNIQMKPIERPISSKPPRPLSSKPRHDKSDSAKPSNNQMDPDNYSLKSYNLSSFVSEKKGIKTPECNLDYYVNQGNQGNSDHELSTHSCNG